MCTVGCVQEHAKRATHRVVRCKDKLKEEGACEGPAPVGPVPAAEDGAGHCHLHYEVLLLQLPRGGNTALGIARWWHSGCLACRSVPAAVACSQLVPCLP